jgi:eukaryotic-like serine/threonine-protein kinase
VELRGGVVHPRFWAEAEVMAAVKHPNVVQVYELGEHDGRPFMAMEFVPGGSLEKRLESGPSAPRVAAELLAKIAVGVSAAHELGIVHRDLKPGNVLLAADGSPKVSGCRGSEEARERRVGNHPVCRG